LADASVIIADDDELVVEGRDALGRLVLVSMRDLGDGISASFWDDELGRLADVEHTSAARVLSADIVADRYFVLTVERPRGVLLKTLLGGGPPDNRLAATLLLAALDVASALHEQGLSAAGMRLRSAVVDGEGDAPRCVITSFGLHVDNGVEVFNELREIALRVLALVGGRFDRENGLALPARALSSELEATLHRAIGLSGPPFHTPGEMAAEVQRAMGSLRPRGAPRSQVRTRPMSTGQPLLGSDLLLAEEFLSSLPRDEH